MSDTFQCQHCNGEIESNPQLAGQEVTCPHCHASLTMPGNPFDFVKDRVSSTDRSSSSVASHRRKKQNLNPMLIAGGGVAVFLLISTCMCCGVVGLFNSGEDDGAGHGAAGNGAAGNGAAGNGAAGNGASNMVDFIDNTEKYKGQVLEFKMMHFSGEGNYGIPLRQRRGTWAKFRLSTWGISDGTGTSATMIIKIPADLELPNVNFGDDVIVRFRCNNGDLIHGNEAIEIRRP